MLFTFLIYEFYKKEQEVKKQNQINLFNHFEECFNKLYQNYSTELNRDENKGFKNEYYRLKGILPKILYNLYFTKLPKNQVSQIRDFYFSLSRINISNDVENFISFLSNSKKDNILSEISLKKIEDL